MSARGQLDVDALKTALVASEARAAAAEAKASDAEAQVAALTLMIEKLRRALYGSRSERKERLLHQLELTLDELTASATEDELASGKAAAKTTEVKGFVRRKPSRKPFPEAPASRAGGGAGADCLRLLWVGAAVEDRRGHHRDARGDPTPLEGDPDGAGEVHVSGLRDDLAAAGAVPRGHRAAGRVRTCWRRSCSRSTGSISLSTGRGTATRGKGSISASRRWPTRWARAPWR